MSAAPEASGVIPSTRRPVAVRAVPTDVELSDVDAVAVPVCVDGDVPKEVGYDRAALTRSGFTGQVGQALPLPTARLLAVFVVGVVVGSMFPWLRRRRPASRR